MARKKIKSATDQRPFIIIYHDFLESDLLTTYQKIVFIALKKFANSKNQCFPSLRKLADITQMSKRKVQDTLKELEEKHIISIENRSKTDGGNTSNLYTLYDFKEVWNVSSSEKLTTIIEEIEEKQMIKTLTAKGYYITKEKELASGSDQTTDTSTQKNQFTNQQNTINEPKSQVERYTMKDIRVLYDYSSLIVQYPDKQTDIDIVFDILYDTLNSTKKTIRIGGEDKPVMVVIGKIMKLDFSDLAYSIEKYHEQTERINNPKSYLLTILYNDKEQHHLDIMNLGHHFGDF